MKLNEQLLYILENEVCKIFYIKKGALFEPPNIKSVLRARRTLWVLLLDYGYTNGQLSSHFGIYPSMVSKAKTTIKKLIEADEHYAKKWEALLEIRNEIKVIQK